MNCNDLPCSSSEGVDTAGVKHPITLALLLFKPEASREPTNAQRYLKQRSYEIQCKVVKKRDLKNMSQFLTLTFETEVIGEQGVVEPNVGDVQRQVEVEANGDDLERAVHCYGQTPMPNQDQTPGECKNCENNQSVTERKH